MQKVRTPWASTGQVTVQSVGLSKQVSTISVRQLLLQKMSGWLQATSPSITHNNSKNAQRHSFSINACK